MLNHFDLIDYLLVAKTYNGLKDNEYFQKKFLQTLHATKWVKTNKVSKVLKNPKYIDWMCGSSKGAPCACNSLLKSGMNANKAACQRKECQIDGKNYIQNVIRQQVCCVNA